MFHKDMSIMDALQAHPRAREVFLKHSMGCLGCMGAILETIEAGALMHDVELGLLLKELNELEKDEIKETQ